MFFDGQKALLTAKNKDPNLKNKMQNYLLHHCNLETEWAADGAEVIRKLGTSLNPNHYEMVILDDENGGLSTSSQVFKLIKQRCFNTSVLYLSTLLEIIDWVLKKRKKIKKDSLSLNSNLLYIAEQTTRRLDTLNALFNSINTESQLEMDMVYRNLCRGMVEQFKVDSALIVLFKLHENTKYKGVVLSHYHNRSIAWPGSPSISDSDEIDLKEMSYIEYLVDYFKPIHIPDLTLDPVFMRELKEILGFTCRSVLMVPLVYRENAIGFYAMFTRNRSRLYPLVDLDIILRLADFAAVSILSVGGIDYIKVQANGWQNILNIKYFTGFRESA